MDKSDKRILSVKKDVSEFKLKSALKALMELSPEIYDGQFHRQIDLLNARFHQIEKDRFLGISKSEELRPEENKLVWDILSLLDTLKEEKRALEQLEILIANQNAIADLKSILTHLNIEFAKETMHKLGECWSEIYQFEREFKKVNNEFVWHYLNQKTSSYELNPISQLELEINSLFPIPPIKSEDYIKERKEAQKDIANILNEAYSDEHKVSSKEHEYFSLKFQKLFEKFEVPDTTLEKNKFWLPKNLYYYAREYHNCYLRYMFFFKQQDYPESLTCLKNMEDEKGNIEKIVLKMNSSKNNILNLE